MHIQILFIIVTFIKCSNDRDKLSSLGNQIAALEYKLMSHDILKPIKREPRENLYMLAQIFVRGAFVYYIGADFIYSLSVLLLDCIFPTRFMFWFIKMIIRVIILLVLVILWFVYSFDQDDKAYMDQRDPFGGTTYELRKKLRNK